MRGESQRAASIFAGRVGAAAATFARRGSAMCARSDASAARSFQLPKWSQPHPSRKATHTNAEAVTASSIAKRHTRADPLSRRRVGRRRSLASRAVCARPRNEPSLHCEALESTALGCVARTTRGRRWEVSAPEDVDRTARGGQQVGAVRVWRALQALDRPSLRSCKQRPKHRMYVRLLARPLARTHARTHRRPDVFTEGTGKGYDLVVGEQASR